MGLKLDEKPIAMLGIDGDDIAACGCSANVRPTAACLARFPTTAPIVVFTHGSLLDPACTLSRSLERELDARPESKKSS